MLYINSTSNQKASKGRKFALCHEAVPGMPNVIELTPERELLERYQSGQITFEEFANLFKQQMRAEYKNPDNRLEGLAEYSVENDVTLHSPEDSSKNNYRGVFVEIIEGIWRRKGVNQTVIDLSAPFVVEEPEEEIEAADEIEAPQTDALPFADIAQACEFFSPDDTQDARVSCVLCKYYDDNIYVCTEKGEVLREYHWEEPESEGENA